MSEEKNKKGLTLIEMLIAVTLIGMITLSLASINVFFWSNFNGIQRKSELQNEALFIISHIRKTALKVVGDINRNPIVFAGLDNLTWWEDANANGTQDQFIDSIVTYSRAANNVLSKTGGVDAGTISRKVTFFSSQVGSTINNVTVDFRECWNPSSLATCGRVDNPTMNVTMRIIMPMVSINE